LRVKDVDFGGNQVVIRDGKSNKDRLMMLPATVESDLPAHIDRARGQHQADLRHGAGWVELPWALARKYPNAGREWGWQWVFPATRIDMGHLTGRRRRHHLYLHARPQPRPRRRPESGQSDVPVVEHPRWTRFTAGAVVLNRRATRHNTVAEGRAVPQRINKSGRAEPVPAPAAGVTLVSRCGVTRFQ